MQKLCKVTSRNSIYFDISADGSVRCQESPYACTHVVSLRHRHFTTQGRAIASDHPPTDIVNPMVLNLIERP